MTITVDAARCIGCGMCAAAVPGIFAEKSRESRVFDAANGCPVNAICITR